MHRRITTLTAGALLALGLGACRTIPYNPDPDCGACDRYLGSANAGCDAPLPEVAPATGTAWENLVFEGGGVKGAAYAGALQVLDKNGLLKGVKRAAGTSAGSILALLVALGYSPDEIMQVLLELDFNQFRDGRALEDFARLRSQFGWYKGDFALCLFECLVERKTGSRATTFAQLETLRATQPEKGYRELRVFGTNVDTHTWVEFSARNPKTRDVAIAQAVRISMSIPYFFAARRFDGDTYVDGGALINYPIRAFDDDAPNPATLGLHLGTSPAADTVTGLISFTGQMFHTLMDTQTDILCATPADTRRSVFIDGLGISATDFGVTPAQKCALVRSGIKAADAYLREARHAESCPLFITSQRPAPSR
jgi:NTE family protein